MGYNIEISFNLNKMQNIIEFEENMRSLASKHKCVNSYIFEDTDFYAKMKRTHSIIVMNFPGIEFDNFICFIRAIKKMKQCNIECIYKDNVVPKLVYASGYYLTIISKQSAANYKTYIRDKLFNNEEQLLLDNCCSFSIIS